MIFYGVMYSGVECVCGVTLSVYSHQASLKICLTTVGIEPATELARRGFDSHRRQADFSTFPV